MDDILNDTGKAGAEVIPERRQPAEPPQGIRVAMKELHAVMTPNRRAFLPLSGKRQVIDLLSLGDDGAPTAQRAAQCAATTTAGSKRILISGGCLAQRMKYERRPCRETASASSGTDPEQLIKSKNEQSAGESTAMAPP